MENSLEYVGYGKWKSLLKRQLSLFKVSSLKNDTVFYGIAVLTERLIGLLIISLLTKTISQEFYGIWTQIIVTTGLLSPIVSMGFHSATVRFLAGEKDNHKLGAIFHRMLGMSLSNIFIVIILTVLFTDSLSKIIFGDIRFLNFVYLFGFFLTGEAIFELTTSFLRSQGRIRTLSIYYFVKNVGRLAVLFYGIFFTTIDFFVILIAVVVFQLALVLWIYIKDIYLEVGVNIRGRGYQWKEIMSFSLPIVPYALLIWGNNCVDRYLILHILEIKKVSIYAVAYSFAAITGLFYGILGYTLYPHMAKLWNEGNKAGAKEILRKGLEYYLFLAIPVIAVLTILSTEFIRIFSTAEYVSNWMIVFWLGMGIGTFGIYQITCYLLLLLNKSLLILNISAIAFVVNTAMNLILIPRIGILGAAITTFISNFILALWGVRTSKRYLPYGFPWRTALESVLKAAVMSAFLVVAMTYIKINNFYTLFSAVIFAVLIYGATDLLSKNSFLLKLAKNL